MSWDFVDDVLVFNTRYDPGRSTAASANFDVDLENALESLSPCHRSVTLSRWGYFLMGGAHRTFAAFCRSDQSSPLMVWSEYPIIAGDVDPGLRHQGRQTGDEIYSGWPPRSKAT